MIIKILAVLLFSASVWSNTVKNKLHTDQYTVMKEDSLSSIYTNLLKNHNRTSLQKITLKPSIRITPIDTTKQEEHYIPASFIAQFLPSIKVFTKHELKNLPRVVGFSDRNTIVYAGHIASNSKNYVVYRVGNALLDPITNKVLAYPAKHIASGIIKTNDNHSLLHVSSLNDAIHLNDILLTASKKETILNYFPSSPEKPIKSTIISLHDDVINTGKYGIVVLDKGLSHGLKIGHTLKIYSKRENGNIFTRYWNNTVKLPNKFIGTLIIFNSFKHVSYALVLRAKESVHLLDVVTG